METDEDLDTEGEVPLLEAEDGVRGAVLGQLSPDHHGERLQVLAVHQHGRLREDVEALLAELQVLQAAHLAADLV